MLDALYRDVVGSDLFEWLRLEFRGEGAGGHGFPLLCFRPSRPDLCDVVEVCLVFEKALTRREDTRLVVAELFLLSSLVNDPQSAGLARDIGVRFFRAVAPSAELAQWELLFVELGRVKGAPADSAPQIGDARSEEALVWRGDRLSCERRSTSCVTVLESCVREHRRCLRIAVMAPEHATRCCESCGSVNLPDFVYCSICGRPRTGSATQTALQSAVPPSPSSASLLPPPSAVRQSTSLPSWPRNPRAREVPAAMRKTVALLASRDESGAAFPDESSPFTFSADAERLSGTEDAALRAGAQSLPRTGRGSADARREAMVRSGDWIAPPGLRGHTGQEIPSDIRFFVPPPGWLGDLQSAWSDCLGLTSDLSQKSLRAGVRALVVASLLCCLAWFAMIASSRLGLLSGLHARVWTTLLPLLSLPLWFCLFMLERRVCSYVGTLGAMRCTRLSIGPFSLGVHVDRLVFSNVVDVTSTSTRRQVDHYRRGVYKGTNCTLVWGFAWHGPYGMVELRAERASTTGAAFERPLDHYDGDLLDFCRSAERAFTVSATERMNADLAAGRPLEFAVYAPGCRCVRVEGEHLLVETDAETRNISAERIKLVLVKDGVIHIEYGAPTDLALPFGAVGNAAILLLVLEQVLGAPVR